MKIKLLAIGFLFVFIISLTGCAADSYYRNGKKSFSNGNYKDAAENFSSAIDRNPHRAEYHIDYGMALIALGQYEEAIASFDNIYMDKNIKMVQENNKRIHRGKGIALLKMYRYQEAMEQFELALSIPELPQLDMDILYYIGNIQKIAGRYEDALDTYSSIIHMDGSNAEAYSDRAYIYRNLGDFDSSLKDYDQAILLEPNVFDHYFGKYYLMVENDKEAEAVQVLDKAAQIRIVSDEDEYNLAKVHYYQGLYDTAYTELSEGFSNGFAEAYYYIGEIYCNRKDYSSAKYYYEQYIKSGEITIPTVYNQIGSCLIKLGEYKQAIDYLEKGIAYQHVGTLKVLMKNEIVAYERLGMFDKAYEKILIYRVQYPEDQEAIKEENFLRTRVVQN